MVEVKSQAKYNKPPVIEVVSGLVFEPVRQMTIAHYGLFWHRIIDQFPEARHALPIGLEGGTPADPFFLPRLWLLNRNQDSLLQLQSNRFYFNWREGANRARYTSYTDIYPRFIEHWKGFLEFLKDSQLPQPPVLQCELTYINHIPTSAGWNSMAEVSKVVNPLSWSAGNTGFLPTPRTVSWNATFDLPDSKGNLTVKMQPAYRGQERELILVLELAAVGAATDASEAGLEAWFGTAHEWIVKGFEDITDKAVQQSIWEKK